MKRLLTMLCLILVAGAPLLAQDSGRSLLSAARKRAKDARGKESTEKTAVYEDCIRILAMIPERFPKERPAVARAWLETGRFWRRLSRPEKAEAAWKRVLETPKEQRPACDALHDLATLYRKMKKRDDAEQMLRRVIKDFPGQPNPRAQALIRLAGLRRDAKAYEESEKLLRQCLNEHGDLWRRGVDALNALVALKLRQKQTEEGRRILDAHTDALRARFDGTAQAERLENALMKMSSRARLEKREVGGGDGRGGNGS